MQIRIPFPFIFPPYCTVLYYWKSEFTSDIHGSQIMLDELPFGCNDNTIQYVH